MTKKRCLRCWKETTSKDYVPLCKECKQWADTQYKK